MAAYTWFTEQDFIKYSTVSDKEINEALQEVRALMPQWYIQENKRIVKRLFRKEKVVITYSVYKQTRNDCEVRYQISAYDKPTVLNLLYGLYMGYHGKIAKKVFFIDEVRKLHNQLLSKDISFSKFVEVLNEKATGLTAIELYKLSQQCK